MQLKAKAAVEQQPFIKYQANQQSIETHSMQRITCKDKLLKVHVCRDQWSPTSFLGTPCVCWLMF
uniref:Uncharacterized protein n=1 Tax=Anguilla anguilla TaxID=7936 RepID=A0A0E9UQF3_ANGAN